MGAAWLTASAAMIRSIEAWSASGGWKDAEEAARDEGFWSNVGRAYLGDGRYLVLNGGGNNPLPRDVIDALAGYDRFAAMQPRPNNGQLASRIDLHRERLARHLGCDGEEVAVTRNTTEGINIIVNGTTMAAGDEVVYTSFDSHYAGQPLRLRAARQGIVLREAEIPIPATDDEIVRRVTAAFSPRTRLVVASHVADGWGYVLPIRRISDEAHRRGISVLADGALSFGHLVCDVRELGCDYFVSSLHKWLAAPLGTGVLYVRRDRIAGTWPLYGAHEPESADIRKFEEIGTRSGATIAAIGQALDFYEAVGPERKEARLRYLGNYLLERLEGIPRLRCYTDPDATRRGSLMRILVDGLKGPEIEKTLRERFGIWTFGNFGPPWDGIYVSPNLFNMPKDLDRFVAAMREIALPTEN
jgi:selenocysteine lyase/cysteine desulfurase